MRWKLEKLGCNNVGRVIPNTYKYFMGDCIATNYFTSDYHKGSLEFAINNAWTWELPSPYERRKI